MKIYINIAMKEWNKINNKNIRIKYKKMYTVELNIEWKIKGIKYTVVLNIKIPRDVQEAMCICALYCSLKY